MARIEADLASALAVVDSSLTQLSRTPVQFKMWGEDIARQIAGVVAGIQAHDITRQQIEHVQEAFVFMAASVRGAESSENGNSENEADQELPQTYAGLTIQIFQLRRIKETVASWASQIRQCMGDIMRVSTSEVVGIGPMVLEREREVSSQLAQIELLERESQAYSGRIQSNLEELSNLMQLVSEQLQGSKSIGDSLQMLAFNSIIEASHLGRQGDAISAISKSINDISAEWDGIADQSEQVMQEILNLVKQMNEVRKAFSEASNQRLREAQMQTRTGLDNLRAAAQFAARQARDLKTAIEKMQAKIAVAGNAGDRLDACFGRIDLVLAEIEEVTRQLAIDDPAVKERYDPVEVERLFSASYTTEMERNVLHAALGGKSLPVAQQTLAGNSVELF